MTRKRGKARKIRPKMERKLTPAQAFEAAMRLHRTGHLDDAEAVYREILAGIPENPDVLHYLGVLCHQQKKSDEAESLIRRALELDLDYVDAHNNLGNVLEDRGRLEEATAAYREAIRLHPGHADAHNNLGVMLKVAGRLDEAVGAYRKAIEIERNHADAYHNLGTALWRQRKAAEATAAYRRSIELRPHNPECYHALCSIFRRTGELDLACEVLRKWLAGEPENPVPRHLLAACRGDAPDRAADDYIRETFDGFAASFDRNLKGLEYRAPWLIAAAVAREERDGGFDVLDAGCGTGLCGPLLRPHARRLVGVDLSQGMLDRARDRGDYDDLVAAELTAFLDEQDSAYDVVASADTLCYFGVLEPVFAVAAKSLREGGRLIFTVEHLQDGDVEVGYRIEPHGRFCHSEGYVERALRDSGMQLVSIDRETLRLEGGEPVPGLVVVARVERA
jgi:predicted TPR repeat methyltransferase